MKKVLVLLFLFVSFVSGAQDNRFVCDDTCSPDEKGRVTYNVVSPVGTSTIEPIKMAARLETLEGKTIAIVGEDFMQNITHPALKQLVKENYPTAKVIMYDELPIAGPYPAPGIIRQSTEQFRQRLIDLKVDAVIAGNGGSGICMPKETDHRLLLAQQGTFVSFTCKPVVLHSFCFQVPTYTLFYPILPYSLSVNDCCQ